MGLSLLLMHEISGGVHVAFARREDSPPTSRIRPITSHGKLTATNVNQIPKPHLLVLAQGTSISSELLPGTESDPDANEPASVSESESEHVIGTGNPMPRPPCCPAWSVEGLAQGPDVLKAPPGHPTIPHQDVP